MHQGLHIGNGADWQQVDAEDYASARHILRSNLTPPSRSSTQVNADLRRAEEVILLVDLMMHGGGWGKSGRGNMCVGERGMWHTQSGGHTSLLGQANALTVRWQVKSQLSGGAGLQRVSEEKELAALWAARVERAQCVVWTATSADREKEKVLGGATNLDELERRTCAVALVFS